MEPRDDENLLIIRLATGAVVIELLPEVAPLHVERIRELTRAGEYDDVAWHRVIDGFVAQTGDVQFGDLEDGYDPALVGTGGSDLPDLPPEFSDISFERGVVGMARAQALDSANSQFFIMFEDTPSLDGRFTVFGEVVAGLEFVDQIKRGDPAANGAVTDPDRIVDIEILADLGPEDGLGQGLSVEEAREVALLYDAGLDLDGAIDLTGLNASIDAREAGLGIDEFADAILLSSEFEENFGDALDPDDPNFLDDDAFVRAMYEVVLDRESDQAGFDFWRSALDAPEFDRATLLRAFAASPENVEDLPALAGLAEVIAGEWAILA